MSPRRLELRERPGDLETPVSAFLKLRRAGIPAFLLESVAGGEQVARYSFLGCGSTRRLTIGGPNGASISDPVAALRAELAPREVIIEGRTPPFRGGSVGFLSYDFVRHLERVPAGSRQPFAEPFPDAEFLTFETIVAFDHVRQTLILMSWDEDAEERLDELEGRLAAPLPTVMSKRPKVGALVSNFERARFTEAVESAKESISAGDIFQVVLSQRWSCDFEGDPFQVYRALRRINPSPYMVFLDTGDLQLAAASPEMLVRVTDGRVETHPIAGTRPRGDDEEENIRLEEELLQDPKEIAEHVMLVDLGRNDVGRVSVPGSVRVPRFKTIERYSHVCHIVSRVTGDLKPGLEAVDALLAAFPAGTVSGAPKIRAMEIIDELEGERRGSYAGAVAYADVAGNLDSCITIRSVSFSAGKAHLQAGAGIVADSVPEREFEETLAKSRALRVALAD